MQPELLNMMLQGTTLANGVNALPGGSVGQQLLASGMNVQALRTCDVLRKDEWKAFDEELIAVAKSRLVGVGELLAAGLRYNLQNAMGTTRLEWEDVSDITPAQLSMSGVTQSQSDRPVFTLKSLPIPIVHKDFDYNVRALAASRKTGEALDTTTMMLAGRRVAELNESTLFNGASLVSAGATITGYTTATNRNTGSLTNWALSGTSGATILAEVLAMVAALKADNHYGPYRLYVPTSYNSKLDEDYKTNSDITIRERILKLAQISSITESSDLADGGSGEVVMVQFTKDVVDMVMGQQPTAVQWPSQGGMVFNFKVLSIMVPRMKSDQTGQSGIAHYSV